MTGSTAQEGLCRFVAAQAGGVHERAVGELRRGHKASHWMWFVFPQLAGLGRSDTARFYALEGLAEARAYLAHPLLGQRLAEAVAAAMPHAAAGAEALFGGIDAVKFRSSLTLFERAAGPAAGPFADALDAFFGGGRDPATLHLLAGRAAR